jgi:SPP1 gp7 family putative phage head morphogenesis protein
MTWDSDLKSSVIEALRELQDIAEERIEDETGEPAPDIEFDLELYANQIMSYFRNYMTMKGDGLGNAVSDVLVKGLSEGQSQTEISNKIEDELGIATERAKLIVDTELSRYASRMYADLSRAAGRDTVVWNVTDDDITCEICVDLDGQEFPIEQDVLPNLSHPRCRCFLTSKIKEE